MKQDTQNADQSPQSAGSGGQKTTGMKFTESLSVLVRYIGEYKVLTLITPFCMLGEVLAEMIIPYLMGNLVDEGIYLSNQGYVNRTGILMIVVALGGLASGSLGAFIGSRASAGFAKNLRKAMFDNIQQYSFANIDRFSTSSLVTRLTTDVTNVQNAFQMIIRGAMRSPFMLVVALTMSFIISPRLAFIYLVAVIILGIFLFLIMRSTNTYFQKVFERYDDLNESVQENVSAIRVVKAYVREDYEIGRFRKAAANIYLMFVKAELNLSWNMPAMNLAVYSCILIISWVGGHMIVSDTLTTGELMSLLAYCMNILNSLMMLGNTFVMITMSTASCRRIAEVIVEDSSMKNPSEPVTQVKDGSIVFEHVDFSYHAGSSEPVLKDINLEIHSGESIGIIGGTGSAKSSLVNLISRLYDVTAGSIRVGGVDVRDYDMEVLRDSVSVVLQKNVLFSGTVIENLRWGNKEATEEDCRRVCRIACADDFISRMPKGYDTYIEQGGSNVSGGQKQRLCIARALLKNPKVLIFDDSTSAVDTATDAKIRAGLAQYMPETTRLVIAQRISSVKECDRIIVMDDGRISGFGTHEELLETNAIYREVFESQVGGAQEGDFDKKES